MGHLTKAKNGVDKIIVDVPEVVKKVFKQRTKEEETKNNVQ